MTRGDPRSLCRYTQGRNISCSFFVILDPCPLQGEKLWYVMRVYLDPEIDSYCCGTIAELLQLRQKKKVRARRAPSARRARAGQTFPLSTYCQAARLVSGFHSLAGLWFKKYQPFFSITWESFCQRWHRTISLWTLPIARDCIALLQGAGFIAEKSELTPTQRLSFIGKSIDTRAATINNVLGALVGAF